MYSPVLFACPMCAMQTPFVFFLSIWIGGVLISYLSLRPWAARISKVWGWPRLIAVRWISLLFLLAWPCLFCWVGLLSNHTISRVAICTVGLVLCDIYAWLRCSWLLEQCCVVRWFRQFLFLSILWPGLLIVGTILGNAAVGLVFLSISWPSMAVSFALPSACVGLLVWMLLYGGLEYVFRNVTAAPPPADTGSDF